MCQFCNEYGLIFVDVDGEEAIPAIEALGGGSIDKIFPPTLTISSGKRQVQNAFPCTCCSHQ